MDSYRMSATAAAAAIAAGELTSEELVRHCLDRIGEFEETVGAWIHLDPEHALAQARDADSERRAGRPTGPLHGVPVGIKDIFDTHDMPTEDGSVLHAGRTPGRDATAVALLRQAGAVIMGKTVTTEFAAYSPGKTANPHDPTRTPGGSSSGSAASVASYMVPLATGTQTNGSVIRPASFCGVYGYKPTHGLISRHRVLQLSRVLDHIGVFARTIEDIALMAEQLMAYDAQDPDMRPRARPALLAAQASEPPMPPRLAFVKTPMWDQAEDDTKAAFAELVDHLGGQAADVALPGAFENAVDWHGTIMRADLARSLAPEYERGRDQLSDIMRGMIEEGQTVKAVDYNDAVGGIADLNGMLDEIFETYDAILTPAAPGEAPLGLEATGNAVFCTIWTLCGTPAISLPLLRGSNTMPMGVQLVGPRGDDARLLRTARWLAAQVG